MPIDGGKGRRLETGLCCAVLSLELLSSMQTTSEAKTSSWLDQKIFCLS